MMVIDNDNGGDGFLCLRHCQSNPALLDHLVVILAFTFQVARAFHYSSAFDEEDIEDFSDHHQRWKKRQTLQTCLCYFSQLVLIFRHRARKTMREECFTHCIISTRAISTSAISINNAFSCYLQIFHSFIGHLRCFVANFLVLIFLGLFCICAILIVFSISG